MGSVLNPERGILDVYCHPNVVFPEAEASRSDQHDLDSEFQANQSYIVRP